MRVALCHGLLHSEPPSSRAHGRNVSSSTYKTGWARSCMLPGMTTGATVFGMDQEFHLGSEDCATSGPCDTPLQEASPIVPSADRRSVPTMARTEGIQPSDMA